MRYYPFLIILMLCSCSLGDREAHSELVNKVIKVDLNEVQPLNLSSFVDRLEYHYLESPKNRPIGRVRKIIPFQDHVGLYDAGRASIWIYTMNGEYVNEVEVPRGRGPGELEQVVDIIISDDGLIHALGTFKIVVYDLEGNFRNQVDYQFRIYRFTYLPDTQEYIGYASNSMNLNQGSEHAGHNLIFFDEDGNITRSFLPIGTGREQIGYGVPNKFPVHNGQIFFFAHLENEIFSVSSTGVKPVMELNFGNYTIPAAVFERRGIYSDIPFEWRDFMEKEIYANNYITFLSSVNILDNFIHLRYGSRSEQFNSIYNRVTGEIMTGPSRMVNDIDHNFVPFFFESTGESLITVIESHDFLTRMNEIYEEKPAIYNGSEMRELRRLAHNLSENSNPILQIAKLKNPAGKEPLSNKY
jgi:hypothetical protein